MNRKLASMVIALAMLAACGTRLPDSAFKESTQRAARVVGSDDIVDEVPVDGDTKATTVAEAAGPLGRGERDAPGSAGRRAQGDTAPNQASDAGITASTIVLGNITAENGVLGDAFAPAVRGLRAWVAATNARGGIRGRRIVLKTCDDREDRARDLACAQQLVERDKVFALVATNTRALGGSAQYLADHAIPVLGMPITNSFYRYPTFFSVYRTNVAREGKPVDTLISTSGYFRWFRDRMRISKVAVFSYDIDESKQAGNLFRKGLELEGFDVTQYVVSFAAPSFDAAVAEMERDGTEMVLDSMDDGAMRKLCDAMARRQFSVKAKVSTIVGLGEGVGTGYNETCRKVAFAIGFTRNYDQTSVAEIARFREAYRRYQPKLPLHQWALEAWMLGNLTGGYLNSSAPTRSGFVAYLNGLRNYTGDGVHTGLDWGKNDPSAERVHDCFTISRWLDNPGGWTDATGAFPFCYPDAFQFGVPALERGN